MLDAAGDRTERVVVSLEGTAQSSSRAVEALGHASRALAEVASQAGVAQTASVEVLTRLTELARGLTAVLSEDRERDGDA